MRSLFSASLHGVLLVALLIPLFALAGRVSIGQQVLYTFQEGGGSVVQDVSGAGSPLDLTIHDLAAVRWVSGGLVVNGPTLIDTAGSATRLIHAIRRSNALTVEAWVKPANIGHLDPARIITLSKDVNSVNFVLAQGMLDKSTSTDEPSDLFDMRVLNTAKSKSSFGALSTAFGTATTRLIHLVFTCDESGLAKLYLDGMEQSSTSLPGSLTGWKNGYRLGLSNDVGSILPWLGEFRLVAVYSRALTDGEVEQNYAAGPAPDSDGEQELLAPILTGFDVVSDELWDETAVRKVMHTFAYGGQATDAQINAWAGMVPRAAIMQMLVFDQHNPLLSPVGPEDFDRLDTRDGTLQGLAGFWSSDDPGNGVYAPHRARYDMFDGYGQLDLVWARAANSRGLNPFRQKIGFWETNYHMATNMEVVPRRVMAHYYDSIMGAHESGQSYRHVVALAAKSAAVAIQYGHLNNVFVNGECKCNEDFAREYHQLFFGILGSEDPYYHETISVKNTAAALTDMQVDRDVVHGGYFAEVNFGTDRHAPMVLEILHTGIGGVDAEQRIDELSRYAIAHPESLENLPVKIVGDLADDNLDDEKKYRIRSAWKSMGEANLLDFLRSYAISTIFHDASRVKYRTSIDRHMLVSNLITLNNREGYLDLYAPFYGYQNEGLKAFFPLHNVFGGQTGEEASRSSRVFRNNFERVTLDAVRFYRASGSSYEQAWEKDWASVIPRSEAGYQVREVTEWLWQRFVADGLKNLGPLERAHLYSLLGAGVDLAYLLDPNEVDRVITASDVQFDPLVGEVVDEMARTTLALNSEISSQRNQANQRIGLAINFIVGTPFMFFEEGR